jgi:hypothetical protein
MSSFNNSAVYNCGSYIVSGLYTGTTQVQVYSNSALPNHFSMRVRIFSLWADDTFNNGDKIQIIVDGVMKGE